MKILVTSLVNAPLVIMLAIHSNTNKQNRCMQTFRTEGILIDKIKWVILFLFHSLELSPVNL